MSIALLIAVMSGLILLTGRYLEKIHVPWIFTALLVGALVSLHNPFNNVTSSDTFSFLANLGMYFLLFLVGLELNAIEMKRQSLFILKSTVIIILFEGICGSLVIHFFFHYSWFVSFLVALSFATVGEAILIPILDEFNLVNSRLGQAIIGIGTADDVFEILILIAATLLIGARTGLSIIAIAAVLAMLCALAFIIVQFAAHKTHDFRFLNKETLLLFTLFIFFLFIGIGSLSDSGPLAAILAGVSLRIFFSKKEFIVAQNGIKILTYSLFGPLFFFWVGLELNISYLITAPLLILLVVIVSNLTKILSSIFVARRELGSQGSILLGIGLSVRFSASIIIIRFLFDNNVIDNRLYSVIIASSIIFNFIVPLLFAQLLFRWGFAKKKVA